MRPAWIIAAGMATAALAHAEQLVPLPAQAPDVPWPTLEWPTGPLPPGIQDKVAAALAVADAKQPNLGETRAVVIVQHGRIVAERYAPGYTAATRLISWSMAKSVTQALVGIAVREKLVDIDKPTGNPRWAPDDPRQRITWRQWENMVDGQEYHEIDRMSDPTTNDAARMLFGIGRRDVAAFGAGLPLIHEPGTYWNYNSAGVNLVCDALGRAFAPGAGPAARRQRVHDVLDHELFGPLGMKSALPQFDATGTFVGSAWVYATARDFARFGLLYLRDGVWDGKRILPQGWVDFARTRGPAPNSGVYGAGFWITAPPGDSMHRWTLCPHGPLDLFTAQGHEGQLVTIIPSKDLVIVRLGLINDRHFDALGQWMEELVALFPDVSAR